MAILLEGVYYDDRIPNWHITPPLQPDTYIMLLAEQGRLNYTLDSATVTMSKGDILFIRRGTQRIGTNGPFPPHQKYSAHFRLAPDADGRLAQEIDRIANAPVKTQRYEYFRQRFVSLFRVWRSQTTFRDMTCVGITMELVGALLDDIRLRNIPPHKWTIVRELEHYILARFREEITIAHLARLVGRTPNYVSTIFKEVTGQTPIEYVRQLRISSARDLLLQTDMTIAEVSDYLGFCDPTYFNRVFKKLCHEPPSALQRRKRP